MKLKVFTVFHNAIDERLVFDAFEPAEIDEYFTLYAVNETKPMKLVTRRDGRSHAAVPGLPNVLLEYQLDWYDPSMQAHGFMETSCYVHLLENKLHLPLDYVGVAQYDMRWLAPAAEVLRHLAREPAASRNTVYGMVCGTLMTAGGQFHPFVFPEHFNWDFLLESYNRFFNCDWDIGVLVDKPFTIWQTYLLPKHEFAMLAEWLGVLCHEVYPWANQPPYQTHWGVLGGYTERAEALFVAARLAAGAITVEPLALIHDPAIAEKLAVAKAHYDINLGRPANGSSSG